MLTRSLKLPYTDVPLLWWHALLAVLLGLAVAFLPPLLVFAALGAVVIVPLVLSYPLAGLAITLFLAPLKAVEMVYIGGPIAAISTGQLMLFFTIGSWLAQGMLRRRTKIPITHMNLPILAFVWLASISLIRSQSLVASVFELVKWIEMLFIVWMVVDLSRHYSQTRFIQQMVGVFLLAGLGQAVLGIWQFAIRGAGPGHFIIFGRLFRATGTFQQPNPFGGYLAMCCLLAIGLLIAYIQPLLDGRTLSRELFIDLVQTHPKVRVTTVAVVLLFFGMIGSWSRGAWLNFAFGGLIMLIFLPRSRARGLSLAAGGAFLLWFLWTLRVIPAAVRDRLGGFLNYFDFSINVRTAGINPENYSVLERLAHWDAGLQMWQHDRWLGVGLGNYEVRYDDFRLPAWEDALGHAHNYYINVLAETGLVGFVGYMVLWSAIFYYTYRLVQYGDALARGIGLGLLAIWSGVSLHHLLDNLYVNNLFIHFGALLALLVLLQLRLDETGKTQFVEESYDRSS